MSREIELQALIKTNETGLSIEQVQKFFTKTPKDKIRSRKAKGGGTWDYVSGSYTTQVLNSLFGFNWSFEIVTPMSDALATARTGTVVVQGRLKVKVGDQWIVKEQYGRKEVAFRKGTQDPLDFGNDMKAAATDAKKKCASELGLFADVYSQEDFFEVKVVDQIEDTESEALIEARKQLQSVESIDELQEAFTKIFKSDPSIARELTPLKDELKEKFNG